MDNSFSALPAADLIASGIADLSRQIPSVPALLVSVGARRLREAGMDVPTAFDDPERRLYELLALKNPDAAHGRYNALIRQLVSFERALECANQ